MAFVGLWQILAAETPRGCWFIGAEELKYLEQHVPPPRKPAPSGRAKSGAAGSGSATSSLTMQQTEVTNLALDCELCNAQFTVRVVFIRMGDLRDCCHCPEGSR